MSEYLTVGEVAEMLRVTTQTVRNWVRGMPGVLEIRGSRGRRLIRIHRSVIAALTNQPDRQPAKTAGVEREGTAPEPLPQLEKTASTERTEESPVTGHPLQEPAKPVEVEREEEARSTQQAGGPDTGRPNPLRKQTEAGKGKRRPREWWR